MSMLRNIEVAFGVAGLSLGAMSCGSHNNGEQLAKARGDVPQQVVNIFEYAATAGISPICLEKVSQYVIDAPLEKASDDEASKQVADVCADTPNALVNIRWLIGNVVGAHNNVQKAKGDN